MLGMCRRTGQPLAGVAHLVQSIEDILTTPLGSRRERMDYGSRIPAMTDQPVTVGWVAAVQSEAIRAIERWEPRIKLQRVLLLSMLDGRPTFRIEGEYQGESLILEVQS